MSCPRLRAIAFAALLSSTVPGCGDDDAGPPADAGLLGETSTGDDAATDAGVEVDAGTPECFGTATECAILDLATCTTVMGCAPSHCGGFPLPCPMRTSIECEASLTCTWTGSACTGDAPPSCSGISDEAACAMETGCTYNPRELCRGTPVRCGALTRDVCESQPGCTLDEHAMDAGPPPEDAGSEEPDV